MIKKTLLFGILTLTLIFAGCSSLNAQKYQAIDEHIQDIEVEEINGYGLVLTIVTKQGGKVSVGLPNTENCPAGFGKKEAFTAALCNTSVPVPSSSESSSQPTPIPPPSSEASESPQRLPSPSSESSNSPAPSEPSAAAESSSAPSSTN